MELKPLSLLSFCSHELMSAVLKHSKKRGFFFFECANIYISDEDRVLLKIVNFCFDNSLMKARYHSKTYPSMFIYVCYSLLYSFLSHKNHFFKCFVQYLIVSRGRNILVPVIPACQDPKSF